MSEYIVDFGTSTYKSNDGLIFAPVEQLRGEIVRCRDCKYRYGCVHLVDDGDDDMRRCDATPYGFCIWGKPRGEELMKPSKYWDDNRTEREFEESGLQCCTRKNDLGHRCGYVALPKGHPLFGKSGDACYYIAPDLDVDGGITFANGTDDMWILGWDAAHAWHRQDWSIASDTFRKRAEEYP